LSENRHLESGLESRENMKASFALVAALVAAAGPAYAKPRIVVAIRQAKEVVENTSAGRKTRMVPTQSASPGDVLEYELTYGNQGDEAAFNAVIEDPIPKGTTFIANSAAGDNSEITFSSDGGKTFAQAVKLTYEVRLPNGTVERRVATPAEYTHIRWTAKQVPAGGGGKVSFRVRVN
jgi:uncharacterized repeat protein (TIGR01451 family)